MAAQVADYWQAYFQLLLHLQTYRQFKPLHFQTLFGPWQGKVVQQKLLNRFPFASPPVMEYQFSGLGILQNPNNQPCPQLLCYRRLHKLELEQLMHLRGFGIMLSPSAAPQQDNLPWNHRKIEHENSSITANLGLALPCDGGSGFTELTMGTSSMFGPKQTTLDFLGLGMASLPKQTTLDFLGLGMASPSGGLRALISSIGGGFDAAVNKFKERVLLSNQQSTK